MMTATIDLYEGNGCSQDLLGSITYKKGRVINFRKEEIQGDKINDEVRSCNLIDLPVGATIRFYDNPDGKTNDDWCEIRVKVSHPQYPIGTLERTYEDYYVKVEYHHKNGLDGKVSRMRMD